MESLVFGLPVVLSGQKHTEQENNATVLEEAGYGKRMSYLTRPEVILACIREVLEDENYSKKTRRLMELGEVLDGSAAVRKFLEEKLEGRPVGEENSKEEKLVDVREKANRSKHILKMRNKG